MAPLAGSPMCKVDVYASSVLDSSLTESWQHARNFGQAPWWASAGQGQFSAKILGTRAMAEIGCERMFTIGHARLFEELVALDDLEHIVRWALVSHPQTLSPFGQASFLNYTSSLQLRAVTMTNQTFAEWRGQFYTEAHYASQMEAVIQSWYFAGFKGLEVCASGLEAMDSPIPQYPPSVLNPNYPVPVQPPPTEQVAFKSPLEVRHPEIPPMSQALPSSGSSRGQFANGAGMATNSSHAWQAARAAFGSNNSQASSSLRSKGNPTQTSPHNSQLPPTQLDHSRRLPSDPSSTESGPRPKNGRRENEPAIPSFGMEGPPIGTSHSNIGAPNPYYTHLGPIEEGIQMSNATPDYITQGPMGNSEPLHRSTSNGSNGAPSSNCSSMNSNHSQNFRNNVRSHFPTTKSPSMDGGSHQAQGRVSASQPRRSWQENQTEMYKRPGSASAMNNEAMQKLKVSSGPRPNDNRNHLRNHLQPDWTNMKEVAFVDSENDAKLMADVAKNMGKHHKQNTQRTSLEEEVAKLQERHQQLHAPRKLASDQPFVSPFSGSASPFEQAPATTNPFAQAQTTPND